MNKEAHSDKSICSFTRRRFFKVDQLSADDIAEKIKKIPNRVGLKRKRADKKRVFSKPKSKKPKPKSKKPKSVAAAEPPKPMAIEEGLQPHSLAGFNEDGLFDAEGNCGITW